MTMTNDKIRGLALPLATLHHGSIYMPSDFVRVRCWLRSPADAVSISTIASIDADQRVNEVRIIQRPNVRRLATPSTSLLPPSDRQDTSLHRYDRSNYQTVMATEWVRMNAPKSTRFWNKTIQCLRSFLSRSFGNYANMPEIVYRKSQRYLEHSIGTHATNLNWTISKIHDNLTSYLEFPRTVHTNLTVCSLFSDSALQNHERWTRWSVGTYATNLNPGLLP